MEMSRKKSLTSTKSSDCQITTDRLLDNESALLELALAPTFKTIVIIFFLGNLSLGNWEAGPNHRHQSSVHPGAHLADYLDGVLHGDPESNQLQNLALDGELVFVSCILTVEEVAQTDKPGRRASRRDGPRNCLVLSKTLHRDGGRGRAVPSPPTSNDNIENRFSLNQAGTLPGSGRAGFHLQIISNRDQMLKPGRQHSLHSEQRQYWRSARWHRPLNKLRVFAKLPACQQHEHRGGMGPKSSASTRYNLTTCSYKSNSLSRRGN